MENNVTTNIRSEQKTIGDIIIPHIVDVVAISIPPTIATAFFIELGLPLTEAIKTAILICVGSATMVLLGSRILKIKLNVRR